MDTERDMDREPVPVPVRRHEENPEREIPDELPDHIEEVHPIPRRWYVY